MAEEEASPRTENTASRFAFGANWARFLSSVDEPRIAAAVGDLQKMLGMERLEGLTFLDAGSGSGLSSLAAYRLGARVVSFDLDDVSVRCTQTLRDRFGDEHRWSVKQGSVLDREFLDQLGRFDIVYSWGVLHHTGAMWDAIKNVTELVEDDGLLFVAIYNDQGWKSRLWRMIKRFYVGSPRLVQVALVGIVTAAVWGVKVIKDTRTGDPLRRWREYYRTRGMSPATDVIDWVGGYPFEVARPDEVLAYLATRGFKPVRVLSVVPRLGCNQFVMKRSVT